jgi:hypothetical protein
VLHWSRDPKYLGTEIRSFFKTSAAWFTKAESCVPGMMKGSHLVSQVLEKMITKRDKVRVLCYETNGLHTTVLNSRWNLSARTWFHPDAAASRFV